MAEGEERRSGEGESGDQPPTAQRLEQGAAQLDQMTRGRVSAFLFMGVLGLPLGCAFLAAFVVLFLALGGALALIGLKTSGVAGILALGLAFVGAFVVVVLVYRRLIPRVPWLRRLINR